MLCNALRCSPSLFPSILCSRLWGLHDVPPCGQPAWTPSPATSAAAHGHRPRPPCWRAPLAAWSAAASPTLSPPRSPARPCSCLSARWWRPRWRRGRPPARAGGAVRGRAAARCVAGRAGGRGQQEAIGRWEPLPHHLGCTSSRKLPLSRRRQSSRVAASQLVERRRSCGSLEQVYERDARQEAKQRIQ